MDDLVIVNLETASAYLEVSQALVTALEKYFPPYVKPADDTAEEELTQVLNRIINGYEYLAFLVPTLKRALSHGCGHIRYALTASEDM